MEKKCIYSLPDVISQERLLRIIERSFEKSNRFGAISGGNILSLSLGDENLHYNILLFILTSKKAST